jgi:co-chaperonin GroES (HSP10)
MENRINIAELLKDCPTGMELDCLMYDNVTLDHVSIDGDYPIKIVTQNGFSTKLTKYGQNVSIGEAKCVIFPKGKTTWEGFVPPCKFKDGDIVAHQNHMGTWIGIYHKHDYLNEAFSSYCCIGRDGKFWACFNNDHGYDKTRLATEEEKQKLFKAIKANGYKWNPETKELEELIQPNFKVGDWITDGVSKCQIYFIDDTQYWYSENCILGSIESVDKQYHLWTINDAKDGDVLFHSDSASNGIFIFKEILQLGTLQKVICYCDYDSEDGFCLGENHTCCWADSKILRPATEERRNRLFQKMREAGYRWNPETKVLEKVVVPEFKVGDKITNGKTSITIGYIDDEYYYEIGRNITTKLLIKNQDEWNLIPKRFDLNTLKPLQPVLVRNTNGQVWTMDFFSHKIDTNKGLQPSIVCVGHCPNQCIPYKGNEFLLGKTDNCNDFYRTW